MKFFKIGFGSFEILNYFLDFLWRFFFEFVYVLDGYMELGRVNESLDLLEVIDMFIYKKFKVIL